MRKAFIVLCLLSVIIGMACKTTRRKSDVSKLSKFYHNTTAKYNGYFNANVLIEESLLQLDNSYEDNYNQLIPIYKWHGAPNIESQYSTLDTAIKKVSVVASLHEPSIWTDDCYLLAGKAHYIKQDYETAEMTLQYLANEFDPSNPSSRFWEFRQDEIRKKERKEKKEKREKRQELKEEKKKERVRSRKEEMRERRRNIKRGKRQSSKKDKEEEKKEVASAETKPIEETNPLYEPTFNEDDYTKGGHEPAFNEGQLWLARTLIERDRFSQALSILRKLSNDPTLQREIQEITYASMGELFIEENEFGRAIPYLEKALNIGKDRQQNARYAYVMAQLYQLERNYSNASELYAEAARLSNDYNMEFTAGIQEIKNTFFSGQSNAGQTLEKLEDELDDSKNREFLDQIYFAMAQIARESGDEQLAQQYLTNALKNSSGKSSIALEAYYTLGEYYFQKDDFRQAKLYYDSVMQIMPKTDERYLMAGRKHASLQKLDEQLNLLLENDSALIIAEMSPEERNLLVQQKLEERRKEREEEQKETTGTLETSSASTAYTPVAGGLRSDFFAYDQQKVSRGQTEFAFTWGDRPLVDDWRRTTQLNTQTGTVASTRDSIPDTSPGELAVVAPEKEVEVLGDFPKSESEIAATRQQIVKALYELGVLYRERLDRPDLAVEVLTQLVERFPRSTKDPEALYLLVLSHRELGQRQEEEIYTKLLLDRYPNSKYAKIINDPDYLAKLQEAENKVENAYREAYYQFESGNYARAFQMSEQAAKRYSSQEDYMPKFKLIEAMARGKVEGKEAYVDELRELISTYERSDEATRAREIIRFLNGNENAFTQAEGQVGDFVTDDDKLHYVIAVLYNSEKMDMTSAKIKVSDFNKQYFKLKGLAQSTIYLDLNQGIPLIIVRNFDNKEDAMRYYQTAKQYAADFLPEEARYDIFAVTQRNYRVILQQRTIESYRPFFEQYYLRSD